MDRIYAKELNEVEEYLKRWNRRKKLLALQNTARDELVKACENPAIHSLVVDIKTRADSDPENPLKTDRKIAVKLYKWRRTHTKKKSKKKEKQPMPSDIHDIAGLTVVCSYPSDTDEFAIFLKNSLVSEFFKVSSFRFMDPSKTKGYRAHHGVLVGTGKFRGLKCEIQIKTFSTLTWGIKTHDLTYKPAGEIDARLSGYMEKLVSVAQLLDEQSEILKSQINDGWGMDVIRRDPARLEMLKGVNQSPDRAATTIVKKIEASADAISVATDSLPVVADILDLVDAYIEKKGYSLEICRVCAIFALTRKLNDYNDWAIEMVDDWLSRLVKDTDEYNKALVFRSLVAMSLGEYEEAIFTGKLVVAVAKENKKPRQITMSESNLAYFYSEAYYHRAFDEAAGGEELIVDGTEECAKIALKMIQRLERAGSLQPQVQDTIGAVLISCSKNEAEIRRGLKLCSGTLDLVKGTAAESSSNAFFALHEKRAFRRLLRF